MEYLMQSLMEYLFTTTTHHANIHHHGARSQSSSSQLSWLGGLPCRMSVSVCSSDPLALPRLRLSSRMG